MIAVKTLTDIHQIGDTAIKELVRQRIGDLGGNSFDADSFGYFLVVESFDALAAINDQLGFDILCNRITGIHYSDTGFTPSFEFVQEFASCYDMVFVISDDGYGIELFVAKEECIDTDLLAMCRMYAFKEDTP